VVTRDTMLCIPRDLDNILQECTDQSHEDFIQDARVQAGRLRVVQPWIEGMFEPKVLEWQDFIARLHGVPH